MMQDKVIYRERLYTSRDTLSSFNTRKIWLFFHIFCNNVAHLDNYRCAGPHQKETHTAQTAGGAGVELETKSRLDEAAMSDANENNTRAHTYTHTHTYAHAHTHTT
jgi:hypothetical protein